MSHLKTEESILNQLKYLILKDFLIFLFIHYSEIKLNKLFFTMFYNS